MKPYPKYQDTGIEWIGEVPEEWKVKKMKYISTVNPTKESDFDKTSDEMVTFLPMENVSESGQVCCDNKKSISSLSTGFTYFKKHDVIIAKITPCFENGKGALLNKLDTEIGFGSTEFHVLRAVESSSPAFLFYITRTYQFRTLGEAFMTGAAGQKRVPTDFIEEFFIALPSLSEQTTIAAFLDRKTEEIDSIISKKERLIELYEEEKGAVINHAVTKGLDPAAKMKDSDIEWLGQIPEYWEVKRLKYVVESMTGGGTPSTENKEFWNGNIPWVSPKDMKVNYIYKTEDYVTEKAIECSSTNLIHPERLLLVVRSGILKHSFPVAINKVAACLNQDMKAIKPIDSIQLNFLFWKIKGVSGYILTQCNKMGATVDSIEISELLDVIITYPKTQEQLAIVQHIETKCSRIDAIISKFKRQIELLKEYRTALISEAVTGKIDVRENMHN